MRDFIYYAPTKVYFGKRKEEEVGKIIKNYGFKKIMMQYGKDSIKKSGLYDTVIKSLSENGIEVIEVSGVEPNPKLDFVRNAVEIAKENEVEMILAVGGGSVIDASKATANAVYNNCDPWDIFTGKIDSQGALPVGCILTIAAAGSEMSASAVVTNMEENMKRGFGSDFNRCLFAIMNPELTYTVSKYQTACGIVDIMAHTMERYFVNCEETDITDRIAEGILKTVISAGKTVMNAPDDYDARANIMWASSLSHNNLTGCGRENALPVHQLEHALSGEFDFISHGAGLAVLFPAWGRYVYTKKPERFAQFARNVWDVDEDDDLKASLIGIEKMEEFFRFIEMPLTLKEFNIPESSLERLADLCTFGRKRTISSYIDLGYDEILDIYKSCY